MNKSKQMEKDNELTYIMNELLEKNATSPPSLRAPNSPPLLMPNLQTPSTDELLDLLKDWKLESLHDHFKNQKITVEILKIIKIRHVKTLMRDFAIGILIYVNFLVYCPLY